MALAKVNTDIEEGTLYSLVRRLKFYGLLNSRWSNEEARKQCYYKISERGEEILTVLKSDWEKLNRSITTIAETST
jgi:DNA-binding PadR family transcriptional regulator